MNGKRKKVNDGIEAAMSAWYYNKQIEPTLLARKSLQFQVGVARVQRRLANWIMTKKIANRQMNIVADKKHDLPESSVIEVKA